jgi:hypothetical protein
MKIKMSKTQWEKIGKTAGWIKTYSENKSPMPSINLSIGDKLNGLWKKNWSKKKERAFDLANWYRENYGGLDTTRMHKLIETRMLDDGFDSEGMSTAITMALSRLP